MSEVIKWLKTFNAKERYFLLAYAQDQEELKLGPFFRGQLSQKLGVVVPEDAFIAMDYHLDWLYAALHVAVHGPDGSHHEADARGRQRPAGCVGVPVGRDQCAL